MKVERHPITTRDAWLGLRAQDVTASVAGALLGVHEYTTPLALWALKSGLVTEDPEETPAMRRGRLLEPIALQLLAEERPDWRVIPANDVYLRAPGLRIGCTPDAYAVDPARPGRGVVQVKTTSDLVFRSKWLDESRVLQPPLWIAVQAIVEARLAGESWAVIALLVVGHGIELHVIEIPLHDGIWTRLVDETRLFWARVAAGEAPAAHYTQDGGTLNALWPPDANGPVLDLSASNRAPVLVDEHLALADAIREAEARKKAINAELTELLAGAPVGRLADGREITRTMQTRAEHVVRASTFPVLRIRYPKRNAA
ncbi:YqaJ viral recombinase family protein [Methylobacterium aquaticum]|uniref:Phage-related protein, predicted endonuclease n=1 Tax=Methylobacterium aquaticum TaxID=270351 RepID=A0A0C6FBZ8_9HYPH|nr:YqaJ viral recombinase family protein [Methylobacterium aquaticum]BAQ44362.1 phage-related protein, predicted endonuclease [Methylobacterium aquaticum]